MSVNLKFDTAGNIEIPTMVIALKSGKKIQPLIEVQDFIFSDSMGNPSKFTFTATKSICSSWNNIKNFRLIWVREWDKWYEMHFDIDEDDKTKKNVTAVHLPEYELSQTNLHSVEINTEKDIARDDYDEPTVFFNSENPEISLLHRITKQAVNFTFGHIDDSLKHIQRMFSFDKISIYEAFQKIAVEIHCYFEFESYTEIDGTIGRRINAYDLEYSCSDCGHRWELEEKTCPKCRSVNIKSGYGKDTTVFLSLDNVLDGVTYTSDVDSVKNCFYLEANDDLMTAAIIACNPNGSQYIWHIPLELKKDMSSELVSKLNDYDTEYEYYYNEYAPNISISQYNSLITKYQKYNTELSLISSPIKGHSALMNVYFDTIDMELYLTSSLMPNTEMSDTNAEEQANNLIQSIKTVAISGAVNSITVNNAVLAMAKAVIDSRYKVEIADGSSLNGSNWSGRFIVTNYSDEEDTCTSTNTNIVITDDYETFIMDKITKVLAKGDDNNYGITGLFEKDLTTFKNELTKYGLSPLELLLDCCQGAIDILIDQGIADKSFYDEYIDVTGQQHLYDKIYVPYLNKLHAIQNEIGVREQEISIVTKLQDDIEVIRNTIQEALNFEKYLGADLWKEFYAFRREDTYQNSNYSSEGLNNAELFRLANEFISVANQEIRKSATLQHSITTTMKNILIMPEFQAMREKFSIGNWIRIEVDGQVYKLRLLSYDLDFDDYENLEVTFSDVTAVGTDVTDVQSILNNAKNIATSYDAVTRQASKGSESYNVLDNWTAKGLDATAVKIMNSADSQDIIYDSHGLLCRRKNDFTDDYDLQQLKIINSTMAMTDDGWNTVKTAVGKIYIYDPETGEYREVWGINGELLCGKLIIGEELGIYNSKATLKFDKDGLKVTNGVNTVTINPNVNNLFVISKDQTNLLYVDTSGNLNLTGNVTATTLTATQSGQIGPWNFNSSSIWKGSSTYGTSGLGNMYFGNSGLSISSTFKVDANGTLSCSGATVSGNITATTLTATNSGTIACWTINSSSIYRSNSAYGAAGGMYFGTSGLSIGSTFKVSSGGVLTCSNATITGDITATTISVKDKLYMYTSQVNKTNVMDFSLDMFGRTILNVGKEAVLIEFLGNDIYMEETGIYVGDNYISINNNTSGYAAGFSGNVDILGHLYLENAKYIFTCDNLMNTLTLIGISSANNIWIGSHETTISATNAMENCYISAKNVYKRTSSGNTSLSDERYKTNISDISNAEDFIMSLSPKIYKFTDGTSNRYHAGFLAGDVKKAMDSTIGDFGVYVRYTFDEETPIDPNNPNTYICGLRYEEIIAPHIKVTQNNYKEIQELKNEIAMMKKELLTLKGM